MTGFVASIRSLCQAYASFFHNNRGAQKLRRYWHFTIPVKGWFWLSIFIGLWLGSIIAIAYILAPFIPENSWLMSQGYSPWFFAFVIGYIIVFLSGWALTYTFEEKRELLKA